jgi:thioredoxin 1
VENNNKRFFLALIVVALFGLGFYIVSGSEGSYKPKANNSSQNSGNQDVLSADTIGPNEIRLTKENFQEEVIEESGLVLVDFYLSTCPACKESAPILTNFANKYPNEVKVAKIEVRENTDVADNYMIQYVPTFILFKDGEEVDRIVGGDVSVEKFFEMIDKQK